MYAIACIRTALAAACLAATVAGAQTQSDMNRQAGSRAGQAAARLAKSVAAYRERLDAEQKALFDASQAQWEKYRDAACRFEASGVEGGSAQPMVLAGCLAAQTQERLKYMSGLANCKEGDLSCPAPKP
jgi:uncharacterized protein YecT (DUF1311 family)